MEKLLDEDTVIKVLEHWKEAFKENSHHVSASDLSLVIKDVKELPPAQPEPQWIPVSERLPEESGYYITSNEYNGVGEDFYYDGHFWNADKNAYSVIAWMPKPESYKQNNE